MKQNTRKPYKITTNKNTKERTNSKGTYYVTSKQETWEMWKLGDKLGVNGRMILEGSGIT